MSSFSTMLVLQQDTAWWLKVHRGEIVDYQVFEIDSQTDISKAEALVPKWRFEESQSDLFYVNLVLDTTIDEVDRVGVPSSGSKIIDHCKQLQTLKRLRKDFPHACVYPLSWHPDERAALMHPVVPDAWSEWLLRVQAFNVVIQGVVTSTQLSCHWSSRFSDYVLLSMPSATRSRHVLIKDGAALFLRTMRVLSPECPGPEINTGSAVTDLNELNQTIDYIRSNTSLATQPVFVVEILSAYSNSSVESTAGENLQFFSDNNSQNFRRTLSPSICCLFAMFYDQKIQCRSRLDVCAVGVNAYSDKGDSGAVGTELDAPPLTKSLATLFVSRSIVKNLTQWIITWRNKDRWLLVAQTLRWANYLQPSLRHMKILRRQRYLSKLSVVMVCVVVIVASVISVNGVAAYRSIARNDLEKRNKGDTIEQRLHTLEEARVPLSFAADSLFVMDELSRESQLSAEFLLTSIARVVTAFPDVSIDRLAWIALEDNELFETLIHGSMAVVARASVAQTDINTHVQMQIEGVVSVAALAHQKSKLDNFLEELKKLPSVSEIRVLESPLDSALSSGAQVHEAGQYRISLLLSGIQ